jgi:hypothetical protein
MGGPFDGMVMVLSLGRVNWILFFQSLLNMYLPQKQVDCSHMREGGSTIPCITQVPASLLTNLNY